MKQLWVVNKPIGKLHKELFGKDATGGLWMEAALQSTRADLSKELVIVNVMKNPSIPEFVDGNVHYYTINGKPNEQYNYNSTQAISAWKAIFVKEKPDCVLLWGTEFPYGLSVYEVCGDIPVIVYVQGVLSSIGKYYTAGMTDFELRKARSIRDILQGTTIRKVQRSYEKRSQYEAEIVRRSGHIIVENHWAEAYYHSVSPNIEAHYCLLNISDAFYKQRWEYDNIVPHTIMCPAADYPIKGLHMMLKALALVKKQYPDVLMLVPGTPMTRKPGLKNYIKQTGYLKYILWLMDKLGLHSNIRFVGRLTADEMAQHMATSHCFVMSSAIENHSSTLKEAMRVGVPAIASFVGGVSEYAVSGNNCLLHRFGDYEVIANDVVRLFENKQLCESLSSNAFHYMQKQAETPINEILMNIIDDIVGKNGK